MISSQDFERLSTYLDDQLSAKEKAALEARLAREPELTAALDELRQTVQALRSLPVVRPPRNFTLSARRVGAAPQRRWFPTFRLATAMAALALMLVFAGDFIAGRAPALSPAAPTQYTTAERSLAPAEAATPAAAMRAAPAPASAPTHMMDQSLSSANAGGGATGGSVSTTATPAANAPMAAAVLGASPATADTTAPAPAGERLAAAAPESTAAAKLAPTEPPASRAPTETFASAKAQAPLAPAETLAPTEAPALPRPAQTLAPPAAEAYPAPTSENVVTPVEMPAPTPGLPWRTAEIGLIGLTLFLAVLTWLMRQR